jgi:hypothetical protein
LFRRFYSRRRAGSESDGLASSIRQAIGGLRGGDGHVAKLQTAFRNGVLSGIETAKSKTRRGWMSRAAEKRFFARWDDIFREIRDTNVRDGVHVLAPADTRELHKSNVIKSVKASHGARRRIPVRTG